MSVTVPTIFAFALSVTSTLASVVAGGTIPGASAQSTGAPPRCTRAEKPVSIQWLPFGATQPRSAWVRSSNGGALVFDLGKPLYFYSARQETPSSTSRNCRK